MKRGFTLIEVILALVLLALLLSLVQGAYTGAARSQERVRAETEEAHRAGIVLQRLTSELSMAFFAPDRKSPTGEYTSGLLLDVDDDGNSALSFSTRVPAVPGFSPGGDAEVGYALERDEEDALHLLRRETSQLDGDLEEGGVPFTVFEDVTRFEVRCYDGEDWVATWDSWEREGPRYLPLAVSVEVAWGGGEQGVDEEAQERVYRTSTPVYGARE